MHEDLRKAFNELCSREAFTIKDVDNLVAIHYPISHHNVMTRYSVAYALERRAREEGKIRWNNNLMRYERS